MEIVSNDWWPKFSKREYARRYDDLRRAMDERGLDCLAIYGAPLFFGTDPGGPNIAYLAAYAPAVHGSRSTIRRRNSTQIMKSRLWQWVLTNHGNFLSRVLHYIHGRKKLFRNGLSAAEKAR